MYVYIFAPSKFLVFSNSDIFFEMQKHGETCKKFFDQQQFPWKDNLEFFY